MNAPGRFRKKPIVIEAMRNDGARSHADLAEWAMRHGSTLRSIGDSIGIDALDGLRLAQPGEWIVREGVRFTVCRSDVFEATYEPVDA